MNDNQNQAELVRLPIAKMQDVLLARFLAREVAARLGFTPAMLTRIATAISEITRNVVQHAGRAGEIEFGQVTQGDRLGIHVTVTDKGRGIAQVQHLMEESALHSAGAGLAGARRLADHFEIQSEPGAGTTVTMDFWKTETTSTPEPEPPKET